MPGFCHRPTILSSQNVCIILCLCLSGFFFLEIPLGVVLLEPGVSKKKLWLMLLQSMPLHACFLCTSKQFPFPFPSPACKHIICSWKELSSYLYKCCRTFPYFPVLWWLFRVSVLLRSPCVLFNCCLLLALRAVLLFLNGYEPIWFECLWWGWHLWLVASQRFLYLLTEYKRKG